MLPSGGRDLHVGARRISGVLQPISHMGTNVPVMAGVALAFRNSGEPRVALTFVGDGATRTGECHEGANFAAVQNLPVIFVLQSNGVALGTRSEQHTAGSMEAWPDMYGIPKAVCDGNNVLEMFAATRIAVDRCRRGEGPAAIVANTFRMGGHATHDEREASATHFRLLFSKNGDAGIRSGSTRSISRDCGIEERASRGYRGGVCGRGGLLLPLRHLDSKDLIPEGTAALYRRIL